MRKITIHQGSSVIELLDDDDKMEIDAYCKELSKIFEASNISMLHTSRSTAILRPSKVTGVIVEEFPSSDKSDEVTKDVVREEEQEDNKEDIIMDVD